MNRAADRARETNLQTQPLEEAEGFSWRRRRRHWNGLDEGVDATEVTYLDTHVLIRLFLGDLEKLSEPARKTIDGDDLLVSHAAVLELEFLHEIGRLDPTASKLIGVLEQDLGLRICELPFRTVVQHALQENWGRDPFDRLIVANAKTNDARLVTKDETIHRNYARAIW